MPTVVGELIYRLKAEADSRELREFERQERKTQATTIALGQILAEAAKQLIAFGVNAARSAVSGLKDLVFGTAAAGDEVAKTAKRFGVSAQELQRLRFAAERTGTPVEALTKGFRTLQKNLGDVLIKGTGPAKDALDAMGISAEELQRVTSEGLEPTMVFLADRINGIEDPSKRTSAQMALMGRAGADLSTLFLEGGKAIEGYGDRAEELGGVLGTDALGEAEAFQDSLADLQLTAKGLAASIGSDLLPMVRGWLEEAREWIQANRELIRQRLEQVIRGVVSAAKALGTAVAFIAENWAPLATSFLAFKAANIAAAFASMGASATAALGPIGAVATALVGVISLAHSAGKALANVIAAEHKNVGPRGTGSELPTSQGLTREETNLRTAARSQVIKYQNQLESGIALSADRKRAQRKLAEAQSFLSRVDDKIAKNQAKRAEVARLREQVAAQKRANEARELAEFEADLTLDDDEPAPRPRGGGRRRGGASSSPAASTPSLDALIGNATGGAGGLGPLGRGSSPGLGGAVTTIDNSRTYSPRVSVSLNLPTGSDVGAPGLSSSIAEQVRRVLEQENRNVVALFSQGGR